MPSVTIIIPVYNTEKYLKQCLDSVINQTYKNIEIIIINDASTDLSSSIIKDYEKTYKNIKVINNPSNLGVAESRNIGLNQANGDYIFFIDSDDWIKTETIEELVKLIQFYDTPLAECKKANVFGKYIIAKTEKEEKETIENYLESPKLLYNKLGTVWDKLYSHSLIGDLRFPTGLIYEDLAFTYPILIKANKCITTNKILYYYRRHSSSLTLSTKLAPNNKFFDIFSISEEIVRNCQKLDTYNEFENIIYELIKSKNLIALMECNTWPRIHFKDKMELLNSIYQFLGTKFDVENFENWEFVQKRMQKEKIYQLRVILLKMSLKMAKNYSLNTDDPINNAKRIIARYKK